MPTRGRVGAAVGVGTLVAAATALIVSVMPDSPARNEDIDCAMLVQPGLSDSERERILSEMEPRRSRYFSIRTEHYAAGLLTQEQFAAECARRPKLPR